MNRPPRHSRNLRPPLCEERLGPACRSRHHSSHTAGRIHFCSCSSARAVPRPFLARGGMTPRSLPTPMEFAATPAAVSFPRASRAHGLSRPAAMTLVTGHWPSGSRRLERSPQQSLGAYVKRALDFMIASVALVMLTPVMAISALAIRRESAGPILYSQVRVGLDRRRRRGPSMNGSERRQTTGYGRPFRIFKFRSMVTGAEQKTGAVWCAENDPRITRVGNFLRRTHLDEIPQLINVLRGEMSIVGPRPERPEFVERLTGEIPGYKQRTSVLPGITGLAQVKYRYDRDLETATKKLQFDLYYIRNSGLLFDVKIMAATVGYMAKKA